MDPDDRLTDLPRNVRDRIRIATDEQGGHWWWTGDILQSRTSTYGRVHITPTERQRRKVRTRSIYIHRYVYEALVGPIPSGLTIDHLCRDSLCCRPSHLEPVTVIENTERRWDAHYATKNGHRNGNGWTGKQLPLFAAWEQLSMFDES